MKDYQLGWPGAAALVAYFDPVKRGMTATPRRIEEDAVWRAAAAKADADTAHDESALPPDADWLPFSTHPSTAGWYITTSINCRYKPDTRTWFDGVRWVAWVGLIDDSVKGDIDPATMPMKAIKADMRWRGKPLDFTHGFTFVLPEPMTAREVIERTRQFMADATKSVQKVVHADNDGWIAWIADAPRPVPAGTKIEVKRPNGDIWHGKAFAMTWPIKAIAAYRILP